MRNVYCGFSGLGESTSVMFCGSFHARAMYLVLRYPSVHVVPNMSPSQCMYSLSMTAPRHELFLLVCEADGSVRECLSN